jgi:hypothetical protein
LKEALLAALGTATVLCLLTASQGFEWSFFVASCHSAFATRLATEFGAAFVACASLEPLNYDVVAKRSPKRTATAVSCLLAAIEIGDPPPASTVLSTEKQKMVPDLPANQGWDAASPGFPRRTKESSTWRGDIDELRTAVFRLAQAADLDDDRACLTMSSGGLVLGSSRVRR